MCREGKESTRSHSEGWNWKKSRNLNVERKKEPPKAFWAVRRHYEKWWFREVNLIELSKWQWKREPCENLGVGWWGLEVGTSKRSEKGGPVWKLLMKEEEATGLDDWEETDYEGAGLSQIIPGLQIKVSKEGNTHIWKKELGKGFGLLWSGRRWWVVSSFQTSFFPPKFVRQLRDFFSLKFS